jgi:hypothetical protein
VEVTDGGYLFEGLIVCGIAVCTILCGADFGNECSFKCAEHAALMFVRLNAQAVVTSSVKEKENVPTNSQKTNKNSWIRKRQFMVETAHSVKADYEKKKIHGSEGWSTRLLRYFFSIKLGSLHLRMC